MAAMGADDHVTESKVILEALADGGLFLEDMEQVILNPGGP